MIYKDYKIDIPEDVNFILETLNSNNYESYIVGGCVRDSLLNKTPNDWDITTNALPNNVCEIFRSLNFNVIETGLKHGTITVMVNDMGYEITTFRVDGEYEDNRHPNNVIFTRSLKDDLSRRDFTINSMAYNKDVGLVDYHDGIKDLKEKRISCVGKAVDRFSEDALRILRAFRFASQLKFSLDDDILNSAILFRGKIKNISKERISCEINKILLSDFSEKISDLFKLGLLEDIIPEINKCINFEQNNKYHNLNVFDHIIKSVNIINPKIHLKLAMLFHDIEKPNFYTQDDDGVGHFYGHVEASAEKSKEILKRLKYDNKTIDKVYKLILFHDRQIGSKKSIKKLLNLIGEDLFSDLLEVKKADIYAQNPIFYNERISKLNDIEISFNEIIKNKECVTTKNLCVNGNDLINLGFKQGKEIGKILNKLLDLVIENPELNSREHLIKYTSENLIK